MVAQHGWARVAGPWGASSRNAWYWRTPSVAPPKKQQLLTLTRLLEGGQVTPVIDRCVGFAQIPEALAYQEEGHAAGKVVVSV